MLVFCDKGDDELHKRYIKDMKENIDMKNFRCIRCINGIKVDLTKIYKTLKIYSIINKEVKGLICNEKLKM